MTTIHDTVGALQLDLFEWADHRKCEREDNASANRIIDLLEMHGVDKLTDIPGWFDQEDRHV